MSTPLIFNKQQFISDNFAFNTKLGCNIVSFSNNGTIQASNIVISNSVTASNIYFTGQLLQNGTPFVNGSSGTISSNLTVTSLSVSTNEYVYGTTFTNRLTVTDSGIFSSGYNPVSSPNISVGSISTQNNSINIGSGTISTSNLVTSNLTSININFTGQLLQNNSPYIGSQWTTSNAIAQIGGSNAVYIIGSNIGIGTAVPLSNLHVQGTVLITSNLTVNSITTTTINTQNNNINAGSGALTVGTINTQGATINVGAITTTTITTQNNTINAGSGALTVGTINTQGATINVGAITTTTITTQNNTINAGSGALTVGTINTQGATINVGAITTTTITTQNNTINAGSGSIYANNVNFTGQLLQNGTPFVSGGGTSSQWTTSNTVTQTGSNSVYIVGSNVGIGTAVPRSNLDLWGTFGVTVGGVQQLSITSNQTSFGFDTLVTPFITATSITTSTLTTTTTTTTTINTQNNSINAGSGTIISGNFGIGTATPTAGGLTVFSNVGNTTTYTPLLQLITGPYLSPGATFSFYTRNGYLGIDPADSANNLGTNKHNFVYSEYGGGNGYGAVGIGVNPVSRFDVQGGVSIGTYAGANAAPTNGLIVSGSVGIGTTNPGLAFSVNGSFNVGSAYYVYPSYNTKTGPYIVQASGYDSVGTTHTIPFLSFGPGNNASADNFSGVLIVTGKSVTTTGKAGVVATYITKQYGVNTQATNIAAPKQGGITTFAISITVNDITVTTDSDVAITWMFIGGS